MHQALAVVSGTGTLFIVCMYLRLQLPLGLWFRKFTFGMLLFVGVDAILDYVINEWEVRDLLVHDLD